MERNLWFVVGVGNLPSGTRVARWRYRVPKPIRATGGAHEDESEPGNQQGIADDHQR